MIHITKAYFNLKMLRKSLGITQKRIADELDCDAATYCKMENGDIPFPLERGKITTSYINNKLTEIGKKTVSMEFIFFTYEVPNSERKE